MAVAIVAAKTRPTILAQYAALVVLHNLDSPPISGHHDKPAPKFNSTITKKLTHLLG